MALLLGCWLTELLALSVVAAAAVYAWFWRRYSYWSSRGVPQAEPQFPFGNIMSSILGQTRLEFVLQDIYYEFRDYNYVGLYAFAKPILLIIDPCLVHHILVKDFDSFRDRGVPFNELEPLNHNLFFIGGNKWKKLRAKLTPTFTSGKLKMMYPAMRNLGKELVEGLEEATLRDDVVEMREVCARYATNIIASVAFGVVCDCYQYPETEFCRWAKKAFKPTMRAKISHLMHDFVPVVARALRIGAGTEKVSTYFRKRVRETVENRAKHNIIRDDFMHLLIQLKNKGFVDDEKFGSLNDSSKDIDNWKLSLDEVAAQAFAFFLAGFETSSTTMSFALYELAINPDVQRQLQEEVDSTLQKSGGKLTYEAIGEMQYLEKVVAETLRMYPPGALLRRKCTRRYQLPDSEVTLEEGTTIFIPTYTLHHDPGYFPRPDHFDPERFSEEQEARRFPYVYLPFGEGPRNCIGMQLGLLQIKIGLVYLMSRFRVQRCDQTKYPMEFNNVSFILMPKSGIQLRLSKRVLTPI